MLQPDDPTFNYYNSTGNLYILTVKYSSIAFLSLIAFFLNLFVVYTTWKNKCFHHRCNIYIGLNSFFLLPLHFGMSVKFFILLFGINFISLRSCYYIQVIPLLFTTFATQIQFYVGVDRLLSVAFPIWYINDRYKSLCIMALLTIIRTSRTFWTFLDMAIEFPERPVMCATGDLLQPEINQETLATANIYTLLTVACYIAIWILMFTRKEISSKNRRLIKSLTVIIVINMTGFVNTQVWLMILPLLKFSAVDIDTFIVVPALLMYVAADGSNMPVLYFFSKEYNRAFKNSFNHLFFGKSLQTVSTTSVGQIGIVTKRNINITRMVNNTAI